MKKLTIIFLSIFIAIPNVHAAGGDHWMCVRTSTGDPCPAGCFYDDENDICSPCPSGSFYPTQNSTNECYACTKPNAASFIHNEDTLGNTSDNCPWELTCAAGQYWDGAKCTNCGTYYASAGCTLTGRGPNNPPSNYDTTCIAIVYKLDLKKNTLFSGFNDKTAYYKYNTGFAMNEKPTTWSTKLPSDALQPELSIKKFKGYYTDAGCNSAIRVFNNSGEFTGTWASLGGDKTLYACWNNLEQQITYLDENGKIIDSTQTCIINDSTGEFNCPIKDNIEPTGEGMAIQEYECTYTDDSGSTKKCESLTVGGNIPPLAQKVYLKIIAEKCRIGYYCSGGVEKPCPKGSTSDAGASSINKCYIGGGENNGTKFCDSIGCFYLGDNLKFYYRINDDETGKN